MPARGDAKPPAPPAKDTWLVKCVAELVRLRPHLETSFGKSKLTHSVALQLWAANGPGSDPVAAARAYHQAHPTS